MWVGRCPSRQHRVIAKVVALHLYRGRPLCQAEAQPASGRVMAKLANTGCAATRAPAWSTSAHNVDVAWRHPRQTAGSLLAGTSQTKKPRLGRSG
jgi:hypothetical protein